MFKRAFSKFNAYTQKEYIDNVLKIHENISLLGFGTLSLAIIWLNDDIKNMKQKIRETEKEINILNKKIDNGKMIERDYI